MWHTYAKKAIWGRENAGGHECIYEAEVLLIALCELMRHLGGIFDCTAQDISKIKEEMLRTLWGDASGETTTCTSYQWGLEGSSPGKSQNAMYRLPFRENSQKESPEKLPLLHHLTEESGDVSEALSAMEEIWRSVFDKGAEGGRYARFCAGARIIIAASGFPLAHKIPGARLLLSGAGNAIVPQVAAEFIAAYMECERESKGE